MEESKVKITTKAIREKWADTSIDRGQTFKDYSYSKQGCQEGRPKKILTHTFNLPYPK